MQSPLLADSWPGFAPEELASMYVKELRAFLPDGPWLLQAGRYASSVAYRTVHPGAFGLKGCRCLSLPLQSNTEVRRRL
jgi:hypothetical protein